MKQLDELRAMGLDQRIEWMNDHMRRSQAMKGFVTVRVDGHLAAMGDMDLFDDLVARFLLFIVRGPKAVPAMQMDDGEFSWGGQ